MVIEKVGDVRARNLRALFELFKTERRRMWPDEPDRGMVRRFAEHLGLNPILLSNLKNGKKVIGVKTARRVELVRGLPSGWMDTNHAREQVPDRCEEQEFRDAVMAVYRQKPDAARALLLRVIHAVGGGKPIESAFANVH